MDQDNGTLLKMKQEIESRFHLVLTLGVFFPALLSTFLDAAKMEKEQVTRIALTWTALVGSFLFNYVFFAIIKNKIPAKIVQWVNRLLLTTIGLFVFPIVLLTTADATKPISSLLNYGSLLISLYVLPLMPTSVFILLLIGAVTFLVKKQ